MKPRIVEFTLNDGRTFRAETDEDDEFCERCDLGELCECEHYLVECTRQHWVEITKDAPAEATEED